LVQLKLQLPVLVGWGWQLRKERHSTLVVPQCLLGALPERLLSRLLPIGKGARVIPPTLKVEC
jgi:hypothetical protein